MKVKYEEANLSPNQAHFGSGYWILTKTTTEVIAAFPSRDILRKHLNDAGIKLNEEIYTNEPINHTN